MGLLGRADTGTARRESPIGRKEINDLREVWQSPRAPEFSGHRFRGSWSRRCWSFLAEVAVTPLAGQRLGFLFFLVARRAVLLALHVLQRIGHVLDFVPDFAAERRWPPFAGWPSRCSRSGAHPVR